MITANGHVIPFAIRDGLVYMDMRPPTDAELNEGPNQLPQLILTSDEKWTPSSIDSEPDYNTHFDTVDDPSKLGYDTPFNDYGEYIGDPELVTFQHDCYSCLNLSTVELPDPPDLINSAVEARHIKANPIDYLAFQPQLGWHNLDTIKKTFKHTTQFYKRAHSTLLYKTHLSPYPACNVPRRNEPIATDTVFSDVPAIDNGARSAQLHVGTKSLVADCHGIKTQKAFINSLLDII